MERPKGSWQPPQRQVTGEVLYIQDQWQRGKRPSPYDQLPEPVRLEFEVAAQAMQVSGAKPEVLRLYEQHDGNPSPLSLSCRALAETLLRLEDPTGETQHARIIPPRDGVQILAQLRAIRAGELLVGDDEQLALPSDVAGGQQDDIRKSAMTLRGVGLDVWQQEHDYLLINDPGTPPQLPRDYLPYPQGEKTHSFALDLSFKYQASDGTYAIETVALNIDASGDLHIFRTVDMQDYEQAGRSDYKSKVLDDASEADVAAFADLLAAIVGDNPETVLQRDERQFREAIARVPNELSRDYLNEWMVNTSVTYVRLQALNTQRDGKTFLDTLIDPETVSSAHKQLVAKVEAARSRRRELIAAGEQHIHGEWEDIVQRS